MKLTIKKWMDEGRMWIWLTALSVSILLLVLFGIISIMIKNASPAFWAYDISLAEYKESCAENGLVIKKYANILEQTDSNYFLKTSDVYAMNNIVNICSSKTTISPLDKDIYSIYRLKYGQLFGEIKSLKLNDVIYSTKTDIENNLPLFIKSSKKNQKNIASLRETILKNVKKQEDNNNLNNLAELTKLNQLINENYIEVESDTGSLVKIYSDNIDEIILPNSLGVFSKIAFYLDKLLDYLTEDPREANTSGGIFPAIFGTVLMVIIMSILVTPIGVLVAIYLNEYAKQNLLTKIIRMSINNLASVPSVVYGVFGLGFFVYTLGSSIDNIFFKDTLPSPTFGTPGLLWCSITLALLTIPVVVISTEEGLSRVPKALKNGSFALGATKYETIKNIIIPIASPSIITGLILAISRAAGEVAPLMLVGVVKISAELPIDAIYPFIHLDQKIMHLGFHIFDLGFQNPNIDLVKPLVYMSALILLILVISLNLIAMLIRDNLRKKFKALE